MMRRVRTLAILSFLAHSFVASSAMAGDGDPLSVSEEQGPNGRICSDPNVVLSASCTGRYCDNNILTCSLPMWSPHWVIPSGGITATPFTSDEYYSSQPLRAVCPVGYAMVGMSAEGRYSDNIRTFCRPLDLTGIQLPWSCSWTNLFVPAISEEGSPTAKALIMYDPPAPGGPGLWYQLGLSGFRCSGSYCDNMEYTSLWYACIQ